MKKDGGSESTIIIGPSKSVLVYALHSLEYVLGLARFRVFVPKLYIIIIKEEIGIDSRVRPTITSLIIVFTNAFKFSSLFKMRPTYLTLVEFWSVVPCFIHCHTSISTKFRYYTLESATS